MAVEPPDQRRAFLKLMTAGLGALTAALAIIPGFGFLCGPLGRRNRRGRGRPLRGAARPGAGPLRVAAERDIKPNRPLRVTAVVPHEDAWLRMEKVTLGSAWLGRTSEGGADPALCT